jgi:hypothetical protein
MLNTVALITPKATNQKRPRLFRTTHGQRQVFPNRELFKHPWTLKLATNPQTSNAVFWAPQQRTPLKQHITLAGGDFSSNHIQKRGFTRAIGSNHSSEFTGLKIEVEITQCEKTIKADGDSTEFKKS